MNSHSTDRKSPEEERQMARDSVFVQREPIEMKQINPHLTDRENRA